MAWTMRAATAAILAAAIACLPLVLDQCAASCEAHHAQVAGTPSCHHASAAGPRIGEAPAPCNHDHTGIVSAGVLGAAVRLISFDSIAAEIAPPLPLAHDDISRLLPAGAPPGPLGSAHAAPLPLRI